MNLSQRFLNHLTSLSGARDNEFQGPSYLDVPLRHFEHEEHEPILDKQWIAYHQQMARSLNETLEAMLIKKENEIHAIHVTNDKSDDREDLRSPIASSDRV